MKIKEQIKIKDTKLKSKIEHECAKNVSKE